MFVIGPFLDLLSNGVKSVWLEPTPQLLVGDVARWAEQADVRPISIPGYWYDKDGCDTPIGAPPEEGEKVVLYLHGSAFIALSAHPHNLTGACIPTVLRHAPAKRGLAVEYRLTDPASNANPFPAALIDCIAGYHYLIDIRLGRGNAWEANRARIEHYSISITLGPLARLISAEGRAQLLRMVSELLSTSPAQPQEPEWSIWN
ncbi:predicted protein [Postia placenta Mad-698-R]|nr:predicted protein [Postia placenta Mad-698-R]